jgi:tricarballylate dehydrogenase
MCAALAAREQGVEVIVLERAPEDEAGGNTRFTAGAIRFAYNGLEDLRELMPDLSEDEIARTDFGAYTEDQFFDDMARVTENRADPDLVELLVRRSKATLMWLRSKGVRFVPIYGRQAFKVNNRFKFWGGLTVESWGGGPGLVDAHKKAAQTHGIPIVYHARALSLLHDDDGVQGLHLAARGKTRGAVPPSCWRRWLRVQRSGARVSRPGLGSAKVRGTRFNTGDGIGWRWMWAPRLAATGPVAMPWAGTAMRPSLAISQSATGFRSTLSLGHHAHRQR